MHRSLVGGRREIAGLIVGVAARKAACLIWMLVLILLTCVWDISEFHQLPLDIEVSRNPTWEHFFNGYKLQGDMLVRKAGHILGFFVLQLLLYRVYGLISVSVSISAAFAALTELAQPLFKRNGLFADIVVDSAGIIIAVVIILVWQKLKKYERGA